MPGLGHHAETLGDQGEPHIVRHGLEPLAGAEELAKRIGEHLAVGGGRKRGLAEHQPLMGAAVAGRPAISGDRGEEVPDGEHAVAAVCSLSPGGRFARAVSHEGLGKRLVVVLQLPADRRIVLIGEPQAESRAEIMVLRQLVVEAVAFRSVADQSCRYASPVLRVTLFDQRFAVFVPVCAGEFQPGDPGTLPRSMIGRGGLVNDIGNIPGRAGCRAVGRRGVGRDGRVGHV